MFKCVFYSHIFGKDKKPYFYFPKNWGIESPFLFHVWNERSSCSSFDRLAIGLLSCIRIHHWQGTWFVHASGCNKQRPQSNWPCSEDLDTEETPSCWGNDSSGWDDPSWGSGSLHRHSLRGFWTSRISSGSCIVDPSWGSGSLHLQDINLEQSVCSLQSPCISVIHVGLSTSYVLIPCYATCSFNFCNDRINEFFTRA